MEYETIQFELSEGVARIVLNRPEAANAINGPMARELLDAALRCDADPAVRAVLITGTGRTFCAGGDLRDFATRGGDTPRYLKELTTYFHGAVSRFARCGKPVVAGVNGVAAGAGFSLALSCDLAIAARSARFTMAYTRAGLTPDGSSTYFLPRVVGMRRALELTLTNRMLSAEEAEHWGIVNRVVDDDQLDVEATKLATELAQGATLALGRSKELLRAGWNESLETQMENETQTIAASAATADYREGSAAFLEKRPPRFSGR
ncbi:MAG TPA: enoyl-CoA hydratase-related protein [Dehalococcoidia bacterium]|jgi:2-(1,2-epoxy-1,2-dihydrophenyl)acetyl-CoA isomerase|nr:enoyl-CoA hydratase-related protein [Dehalococcoidia bacterium]